MQPCIAIDWLQVHVNVPMKNYELVETDLHVTKEPYGTRHFKAIYKIFDRPDGEEIATLAADPHHGDWNYQFGLLKISNKMLYQVDLKKWVLKLLATLKLEFVNITRLDIAHDFQNFDNNMRPDNFIKNYLNGRYMKTGKTKVKTQGKSTFKTDTGTKKYLRESIEKQQKNSLSEFEKSLDGLDEGIKKKIVAAKQKADKETVKNLNKNDLFYNLQYDYQEVIKAEFSNASKLSFEYLKFGTEKSPISYTLYNKTKEMQDVKVKPWIQDHWRNWGWDGKQTVWRLEFSFKSTTMAYIDVDPETGEGGGQLHFKDLSILDRARDIFDFHFKKYFCFVYNQGKSRKDRMKKLSLLSDISSNMVRINLSEKREAMRADKVFTKKLMELNQELRGHDFELSILGNEMLTYVVAMRGLNTWFENKFPSEQLSDVQQMHAAQDVQTLSVQNIFSLKKRPWDRQKSWLYDNKTYATHNIIAMNNQLRK